MVRTESKKFAGVFAGMALSVANVPAYAGASDIDVSSLAIDIGRWDVMLDQVGERMPSASSEGEDSTASPEKLAHQLVSQVWAYNLIRAQACTEGVAIATSCGPGWVPGWAAKPKAKAPSLAVISRRSDEIGEHIGALWDAVCNEAAANGTSPQCQIE